MRVFEPGDTTVTVPGGTSTPSASPTPYTPGASAAPPVAPTPGPDSVTVGASAGSTPDYQAAIQNDPGYAAAQSANQQSSANANAQRQAALRAAVIKYGGLQPGFKDAYGDIDQATMDAASSNQYSTLASMKRNYEQSVDQFRKALAARGATQSGDMAYGQDQIDTGYGQNEYDAGNAFGNEATGALNQYAGVMDANNQRLAGAIQGAASNAYNDPANRPVAANPGTTAKRDSAMSSQYGVDVYSDGNGNYYDRSGNPWTPPSASASASPYTPGTGYGNAYRPGVQMGDF